MAARSREPVQLTLALDHLESLAREDFVAGPTNAAALDMIERWPDWPARALALVGPPGSGKSHLAAIWAKSSAAPILAAGALDEASVPAMLSTGACVVEDVGEGALNERALFHLLNVATEEQGYILLTGARPLAAWKVRLPDLMSRLRAVPMVTVAPPDEALFRAVLVKLFADRQLTVEEALLIYLERRMERSLVAAKAVVAALDRAGLRKGRPITRALAAEVLGAEDDKLGG